MTKNFATTVFLALAVLTGITLRHGEAPAESASASFRMSQDGIVGGAHHTQTSASFQAQSVIGQSGPTGLSFGNESEVALFSGSFSGGPAGFRIGEELPAPPGWNGSPPMITPSIKAFYISQNGKVYANEAGSVSVTWPGATTLQYEIVDVYARPPVYLPLNWKEAFGQGEVQGVTLPGNQTTTIRFNSNIVQNRGDGQTMVLIQEGRIRFNYSTDVNHPEYNRPGYVVLTYVNGASQFTGLEIVEIIDPDQPPFRRDTQVVVGERVLPSDQLALECDPLVAFNSDGGRYLYRHAMAGMNLNWIFSGWENATPSKAGVFWFAKGLHDVCWPTELRRYTAVWPTDPQTHVRGGQPVNLQNAQGSLVSLHFSSTGAGALSNGMFTAGVAGYSVFIHNEGTPRGDTVSLQVVRTYQPNDPTVTRQSAVRAGERLVPIAPVAQKIHPEVAVNGTQMNNDKDIYMYVHSAAPVGAASAGYAFSTWENADANRAILYWFESDSRNIRWPMEYHKYTATFPNNPRIHIFGGKPVEIGHVHGSGNVQIWKNHSTAGGTFDGNNFAATQEGYSTLIYQLGNPRGDTVAVQVVRSYGHLNQTVYSTDAWDIGDRIVSDLHDDTCLTKEGNANNGYLHSGRNYDPSLATQGTVEGVVFPVNVGDIEMWWYEKELDVCWPYKAVKYTCDWPTTPEGCIIIANERGFDKYRNTTLFGSLSIYALGEVDGDPMAIGYNPNEEHAQWAERPAGTLGAPAGQKLFASRTDLNSRHSRSEPYALVKYRQITQSGQPWEFDVIGVKATGDSVITAKGVPNCPCNLEPCNFIYPVTAGAPLRIPLPLALPINDPACQENQLIGNPNYYWNDGRGKLWFVQGDQFLIGRYWERWMGECKPWMDPDNNNVPHDVNLDISWPPNGIRIGDQIPGGNIKNAYIIVEPGETIIRDLTKGVRKAEILYNEAGASLIRPWRPSSVPLSPASFPDDYVAFFAKLPPHIQARLSYDEVNGQLQFSGNSALNLLGIMSIADREIIKSTFNQPHHAALRGAVDALHAASQQTGVNAVGTTVGPQDTDWGIALSAGSANREGYVVLGYNGEDLTIGEPVDVEVFRVQCPLHRGSIQVVYPDCPFSEQITLRWSGDCAGDCMDYEFKWEFAVGSRPVDYDEVTDSTPGVNSPYADWTFDDGKSGWVKGANEVIIRGDGRNPLFTLTDNWFRVKVRIPPDANPADWPCTPGSESPYTDAQLAEGWIKRVKRGINPFDQRNRRFEHNAVATYVSLIEQLGTPYRDRVGFTCEASVVNNLGLIELYQGVLYRGRSFTIDLGVDYAPANQALLLMAGNLADFYTLLANEAYGDSIDPTIAVTVDQRADAASMFCFQDQLPSNENSLIYEELSLLRGRDNRDTPTDQWPFFNRLPWNFTLGSGQIAYVSNYNIQDKWNSASGQRGMDGTINVDDAKVMYPQAHGDSWGHYLTAMKFYYDLLSHSVFTWDVRSEAVLVDQTPVEVSFAHERRFARVAAAKAKTGSEITSLTYREQYLEDPSEQWPGYEDPVPERHWGVEDWAERSFMGAYFDWATANSILPAVDADPTHQGTLKKVDRTTIPELRQIAEEAVAVQNQLDRVDEGLNPLGLAKNALPFDISPSGIDQGKTHFEQIYDRAVTALNNTIVVFNHANQSANSLRRNQDEEVDFNNNVADREADVNNRLIGIFGYPYPEDRDPLTGNQYGSNAHVPDLYHWAYVDVEDLLGVSLPEGERLRVQFQHPVVGQDGAITYTDDVVPVEFNVVPGFGLVKPRDFNLQRKAPGEVQLARSDLIQAKFRLDRSLEDYEETLRQIEDAANLLQAQMNLQRTEILIQERNNQTQQNLNDMIIASKQRQESLRMQARMATLVSNSVAEGIPTNFIAGLASGGDFGSVARSAIRIAGTVITEVMTRSADQEAISEVRFSQAKELANSLTQIELTTIRNEFQNLQQLRQIEQMVRRLNGQEIEIFSQEEAVRQASGRYLSAIQKGARLIDDRTRFRVQTAAKLTQHRYQDAAFRIFRNDALQKFRAQFDLAARYVYLSAKAYDYETNLISGQNTRAGENFFRDILRQRTIGLIEQGLPLVGSGLADVLARMSQNWGVIKQQLGFDNPQTETNRFSLRRELHRIKSGAGSSASWQETLDRLRVDDLRTDEEFRRLCIPYWTSEPSAPQPAIVIPFGTNITSQLNYFGWPLAGGDSFYSTTNFTTKVRSVGVWFSNYNATASIGGLSNTPRVYLVPAGEDIMRDPDTREPREWLLFDQRLPSPFPLNINNLIANRNWLPDVDTVQGVVEARRTGDFRAYHDNGNFMQSEAINNNRLIGRSVWNARWLLIIPGATLLADADRALDLFIHGNGNPGEGISDILIFFQTYGYSAGKATD
ncbi:MAG: hypothetical protein GHCLOJNM_02993 [bacterium]|nr:hypothetical protein [bacterium]